MPHTCQPMGRSPVSAPGRAGAWGRVRGLKDLSTWESPLSLFSFFPRLSLRPFNHCYQTRGNPAWQTGCIRVAFASVPGVLHLPTCVQKDSSEGL